MFLKTQGNSGGKKAFSGVTPVITTSFQEIECGFKPTHVFMVLSDGNIPANFYYVELGNSSSIVKLQYYINDTTHSVSQGGAGINKNVPTTDILATENGFKIISHTGWADIGKIYDFVAYQV